MSRVKCIKSNIKILTQSKGTTLATVATKRITGRRCQQAKRDVMVRDGFRCRVCGRVTADGEVDHIIPLHLGGSEANANLQWLCKEPCHSEKSKAEGAARGGFEAKR